MTTEETRDAYSSVAELYISLLGTMEAVDPADQAFIREAFRDVTGTVLDAGCGPGHLTSYLTGLGHQAIGVDAVPRFIEHAQQTHPGIAFSLGDLSHLGVGDGSLGGILSWYSMIHLSSTEFDDALAQFRRALTPGGVLVLGLVPGDTLSTFDHKVTPATTWPLPEVVTRLEQAGFNPGEHETRPATPHLRAHLAITAIRTGENQEFATGLT